VGELSLLKLYIFGEKPISQSYRCGNFYNKISRGSANYSKITPSTLYEEKYL
jgi:hypothetical protein